MSLTIYLLTPQKCPSCGFKLSDEGHTIFDANITHNVQNMWKKAGVLEILYDTDGQFVTAEMADKLNKGAADMRANFVEYEKLDAPNGWGRAIHVLPWLERVAQVFEENIGAMIRVSR